MVHWPPAEMTMRAQQALHDRLRRQRALILESEPFSMTFTARSDHIDELGHVNNAVWVAWLQQLSTSHWDAVARPEDKARYFWVVIRHEIDYRGNIGLGESVTGLTHIPNPPCGAKSVRLAEFSDPSGKTIVRSSTTWAMLERASGKLARVRPEILAPFLASAPR